MPSINWEEGDLNPRNYHIEEYESVTWQADHYWDGVYHHSGSPYNLYSNAVIDVFNGRELRDYHRRRNRGELLPMTQYTKILHSLEVQGKHDLVSWTPNVVTFSNERKVISGRSGAQHLSFYKSGELPFDQALATRATNYVQAAGIDPSGYVQAAASKLYSRGWDAGTFFAEVHKTAQLVHSGCQKLLDLLEDWTTAVASRGGDLLVLQQWLESRYGWRLLVYDIQDINRTIAGIGTKALTRNKERVGLTVNEIEDLSYSGSSSTWTHTYSDIRKIEIGVRGRIIADFMPSAIILNPLTTSWEVIPYSFVIDWFFSIGRALEALSFLLLSDQYTAAYGLYVSVERDGNLTFTGTNGAVYNTYQTVKQRWEYVERHPVKYIPYLPKLDYRFDWAKMIDLIALIDGLLRGILRKAAYR